MQREGLVTAFASWQQKGQLHAPPERLAEADRVADAVLARWLEMAQPMVTEELAEFWAYAALWLSQWLLVQHTAAWLRSES